MRSHSCLLSEARVGLGVKLEMKNNSPPKVFQSHCERERERDCMARAGLPAH